MSNQPAQPPDTASNGNNPTRTRAKRRFDAKTISAIARFCAKQLSESEACRLLKIRPQSWFSWKARHNRSEKFAALLEEFRAGRIDDLIARIEKSADGVGMKQPDWRAAAFLLTVADGKRFSTSGGVAVEVNVAAPILTVAQMERIQREFLKSKAAIEIAPPPKQISSGEIMPERVAQK